MIVYNITIKIDPSIETAWLKWQQEEHIPEVMSSGQFTDNKFFRLLDPPDNEGITYVVQYFAPTLEHYESYIAGFAPALRKKAFDRWGDQFIAFRTIMEVVN